MFFSFKSAAKCKAVKDKEANLQVRAEHRFMKYGSSAICHLLVEPQWHATRDINLYAQMQCTAVEPVPVTAKAMSHVIALLVIIINEQQKLLH